MTRDAAYFLYHSIGLYPGKAAEMHEAFSAFSDAWAAPDDSQWPRVLAARAEFLELWCRLIEAPDGSLTTAENVTAALYSILGGLPREYLRDRVVLVGADCFPSLHFLMSGLQDRLGFTLRTVPLREGESWVREEDMIAAWGPEVGVALLTFVTSTASYRADLPTLVAHGHAQGSLVGVDLTQGIGLLPYSAAALPADFVVSTSLKWLCGTPGAGILQMRPKLIAECRPELRGWFSQPNPFAWDLDGFSYAPDMRRFDHGTPSVLASAGSAPALRRALIGAEDRLAHNRALTGAIMDAAEARRLQLASPAIEARRGGSVMLRLPQEADPPALVNALRARGVHTDSRGPVLRLSPGEVTAPDHVDALFAALDELL